MATEMNMITRPIFMKSVNFILYPDFSANPATTRLALAPIRVPLPPRQAPRASDHQIGSRLVKTEDI